MIPLSESLEKFRTNNLTQYVILLIQFEMLAHQEDKGSVYKQLSEDYLAVIAEIERSIKSEKTSPKQHIEAIKQEIALLEEWHQKLLKDEDNSIYQGIYELVLPHIVLLRSKTDEPKGEVETLLVALMGCVSLSVQSHDSLSYGTKKAAEQIASLFNCINESYAESIQKA